MKNKLALTHDSIVISTSALINNLNKINDKIYYVGIHSSLDEISEDVKNLINQVKQTDNRQNKTK
tara:strand:- start:360 stop:554 length:195 start_codon:yes stop_codon:yes gene_type:complete